MLALTYPSLSAVFIALAGVFILAAVYEIFRKPRPYSDPEPPQPVFGEVPTTAPAPLPSLMFATAFVRRLHVVLVQSHKVTEQVHTHLRSSTSAFLAQLGTTQPAAEIEVQSVNAGLRSEENTVNCLHALLDMVHKDEPVHVLALDSTATKIVKQAINKFRNTPHVIRNGGPEISLYKFLSFWIPFRPAAEDREQSLTCCWQLCNVYPPQPRA